MPQPTKFHRALFTGDRDWRADYPRVIKREIRKLKAKYSDKLIVIVGGAPGVDSLTREICWKENVHCAEVKALWHTRGNGAGPQRNEAMLSLDPDEVIAIHLNYSQSKGTKDCVTKAKKLGIPARIVEI